MREFCTTNQEARSCLLYKSVPNAGKGEGVKKSENFLDFFNGCLLRVRSLVAAPTIRTQEHSTFSCRSFRTFDVIVVSEAVFRHFSVEGRGCSSTPEITLSRETTPNLSSFRRAEPPLHNTSLFYCRSGFYLQISLVFASIAVGWSVD